MKVDGVASCFEQGNIVMCCLLMATYLLPTLMGTDSDCRAADEQGNTRREIYYTEVAQHVYKTC